MSLISRIINPKQASLDETPVGGSPIAKVNAHSGIHLFPVDPVAHVLHDLIQPLNVMAGYIGMAQEDLLVPGKRGINAQGCLEVLLGEVEHMVRMVNCLNPSVQSPIQWQDLSRTVKSYERVLHRVVEQAGQTLELDLAPELYASVDGLMVARALRNLVKNASEAMVPGQKIRITTGAVSLSNPPYCVPPGDYVRLAVCDEGPGMGRETIGNLFQPFYTTKEGGNGLGLLSVLAAMHKHHGTVEVRSAPGNGTQMILYFPRVDYTPKMRVPAKI